MPFGQKTKSIKQKQYCNKFKKDFTNGPHQKSLKKKKKETAQGSTSNFNAMWESPRMPDLQGFR